MLLSALILPPLVLARPASEYIARITDRHAEALAGKVPSLRVPLEEDASTVYLLAKPDYEFPLPAAIASHLGPFKQRRYEDANGDWRAVTHEDRAVYDAANGMSDAILRWNDGFWLVAPSTVAFNSSKSHLSIADSAMVPWHIGHPSWAIVKNGEWVRHWVDVYTGTDGAEEYDAVRERARSRALGGAEFLELRAAMADGGPETFPHLRPVYGNYSRNPGQLHLERPVYSSSDGRYVLHYDVSGPRGSWLISYAELFSSHDAVMQVRTEAFLPELIESNATWQGEDHTRAAWADLTEHRIAFRPRAVNVVPQVGPSIFDAADATTEWRINETTAEGCAECRWRTPEEARAARDQRRAYAGAVWFAGSAGTVALWMAASYLVLKVV